MTPQLAYGTRLRHMSGMQVRIFENPGTSWSWIPRIVVVFQPIRGAA